MWASVRLGNRLERNGAIIGVVRAEEKESVEKMKMTIIQTRTAARFTMRSWRDTDLFMTLDAAQLWMRQDTNGDFRTKANHSRIDACDDEREPPL